MEKLEELCETLNILMIDPGDDISLTSKEEYYIASDKSGGVCLIHRVGCESFPGLGYESFPVFGNQFLEEDDLYQRIADFILGYFKGKNS